jgi:hypothetical protein
MKSGEQFLAADRVKARRNKEEEIKENRQQGEKFLKWIPLSLK